MTTPHIDKFLTLEDGRSLAYDDNGDSNSKTVVLYFHGNMSVGDARSFPESFAKKNIHFVAPSLPGWGLTSPRPSGVPFHTVLRRDMKALLSHLHPNMASDERYKLYIAGGSYGSVSAHIMYGSSLEDFPQRDRTVGVLLLGGFAPLYKIPDYRKLMTTTEYMSIGPVAYNSPFKLLPRIVAWAIGSKVSTPEKGAAFIKSFMFDKMSQEEKDAIEKEKGKPIDKVVEDMGEGVWKSIHKTYAGFIDISTAANADWGLRDEVFKSPDDPTTHFPGFARILVASARDDELVSFSLAEWNVSHYKNGEMFDVPGGHLGVMAHMNEIWNKFLDG